jgi:hypothetical protein
MKHLLLPAVGRFSRIVLKLVSHLSFLLSVGISVQTLSAFPDASDPEPRLIAFQRGDVVAFLGGEDVAAQKESGHLQTLLSIRFPGVLFRNLGWEGDTVFAQPRDVGFPDLPTSLRAAGTTVIVAQFGRTEALNGGDVEAFAQAYAKMLDACSPVTSRLLLVTPPPFENGGGLLPDLSGRNTILATYVEAIRKLAFERRLPVVDLFAAFSGPSHHEKRLTENGMQLSLRGQGLIALAFARQLKLGNLAQRAGEPRPNGAWVDPQLEKLRQEILTKDTVWFNYYRPQNWAFLGGDRISQPSSRDHLNPNVRWFPSEMEKFVPLIHAREAEIEKLASSLR